MNNMNRRYSPIVIIAGAVGVISVLTAIGIAVLPSVGPRSSMMGLGTSFNAVAPSPALQRTESFATDSSAGFAGKMMVGGIVPPMNGQTAGETAAEVDQKIIKTGYLSLAVEHAEEAASALSALATGLGGYVQNSSLEERADGTKFGSVTIRIPSKRFEDAMTEAKKLATQVKSENVGGQDVTEQFTDLEAQLRNAKAQELEYLNILKKAQTVQDILSVQSYLGGVRSQIESLQGRLKYLENQTSYATLSVALSEDARVTVPGRDFRPLNDLKTAAQALVVVFQSLVTWIIWFVVIGGGVLIPLALVVWALVALAKRFLGRRRV